MRGCMAFVILPCLAMAALLPASAQESLDTILERGYIAHWLVCGPFEPDVEGGIVAALRRGEAPLGDRDYMAPVGGIARLRPKHLLAVAKEGEDALWQQAGTQDTSLDLAPFFPEASEGVSYAAFYTTAEGPRTAYADLQTPLGARVWLNGFPLREIAAAPVTAAGADRFTFTFRKGLNLVVLEVPGGSYEALAEAAEMSVRELSVRGYLNRPLLKGLSGFEIALRLEPAFPLGDVFYVPRLENAGTFSGTATVIRQDTLLTLYNAAKNPSPPIDLVASVTGTPQPIAQRVFSIPPESEWKERIALPTGSTLAGQGLRVNVGLVMQEASASFTTNVSVMEHPAGGRMYVVTGQRYYPQAPEDQTQEIERRNHSFIRQTVVADREPDYGFDLGTVTQWHPALVAHPDARAKILLAAGLGRCGAQAAYAQPDGRLVAGEALLRDLVYGILPARAFLEDFRQAYYAWDVPGMPPQMPQLLAQAGLPGLVSNLDIPGLPELFHHEGLDGTAVFHRRKQSTTGPGSVGALRQMVALQRRELLARGIDVDVLVNESLTPPPEPFFLGTSKELLEAYPSIRLTGAGGRAFLDDLDQVGGDIRSTIPLSARLMTLAYPGSILTQPELKRAHALVETRLLIAERFATFAALLGAEFPEAALDLAWRQLLYWSAPDRLGLAKTEHTYIDALAGYREAAELSGEVLGRSLTYIAEEAGTLDAAPAHTQGTAALVVFNPSPWPRTDLCEIVVPLNQAPGLSLLDDGGKPVAFLADRIRSERDGTLRGARLRFLAQAVPPLGYRCYYLQPEGSLPQPSVRQDVQIENEALLLTVNAQTGNVSSLVDKLNGTRYAAGPLNRIVALQEDPERTGHGRELWTTGTQTLTVSAPPKVHTLVTDWMQRLTVTAPFAGGTLVREMTLYRGVPRVECETRIEGVALKDRLLAATFAVPPQGRAPVYGERYGAVIGRRSKGTLDYRTALIENPSGTAAQPALHWAALSPNDYVQAGPDGALPLAPAAVVHGADAALERAAREVAHALTARGIPSFPQSAKARKLDFLWTDTTELPSLDADLDHGAGMRIVIGDPEQNAFCGRVLDGQEAAVIKAFSERLAQGAVFFFEDKTGPEGYAPVPTLVFAGLTPGKSAGLASDFARSVAARGVYALPLSAYVPGQPPAIPTHGLAVVYPGTRLCCVERDGLLTMALAHGGKIPSSEGLLPPEPQTHTFRYALYPFSGSWRSAGVPRAARDHHQALVATISDLHSGRQPNTQSFLTLDGDDLILSAVKPAGYQYASLSNTPRDARNGVVLRVFEPFGRSAQATLRFFLPLRGAAAADLFEEPGASLSPTGNELSLKTGPFRIAALWILPTARFPHGEKRALAPAASPYGPIHTRYWQHNPGAAPLAFQPIGVLLDGTFGEGDAPVEVTVVNNRVDTSVEGLVTVQAAEGWSFGPPRFYYALGPGEVMHQPISVVRTGGDPATAGMVASTPYAGQTYRDVIETAETPLSLSVTWTGAQVKVSVQNRSGIAAEGIADLIVPTGYWPELEGFPEVTVMPRRAAVSIPPYKSQDILFRFSDPDVRPWAVVKLAANGHVLYAPAPL